MIRFAQPEDIENIMQFIGTHWKAGHILSRDRRLFEFEHLWDGEVSFVISEDNGAINAILGYIPYDQDNRDIALVVWRALKTDEPMLGMQLQNFLRDNGRVISRSAPGINKRVVPAYRLLGMNTGIMKHWYRLARHDYIIASVSAPEIPEYTSSSEADIVTLNDFDEAASVFKIEECIRREHQLTKSLPFLERRYYRHPYFEYLKYGVRLDTKKLIVVLRVQRHNGSGALRVIDCIGDNELFRYFTPKIDALMSELGCEYSDCYETGIDDEVFTSGGWLQVEGSGNIIPEYFSPFEQRNIDILYTSSIDNVILFKGDGDMDRPN